MTRPVQQGTFNRSCRQCGWSGTYTTAARGDYAKRRHSCAKRIAKATASAAYAARLAAIDRTPKPCLHKLANHQHGTNAAYVLDFCRCPPCGAARHATDEHRIRQQAYGRYDRYVDAGEARDHIRTLMAAGMGLKRIVAVSDLSQGMLWKLIYGKRKPDGTRTPTKRVLRTTHDRILAVRLNLADGALVDVTGTTRRVRALVALGWSQSKIAARLGMGRSNFFLARGNRPVTAGTARAVVALYDELSMRLPPEENHRDRIAASRARRYSSALGWLPPLALDDDRLEDPTYRPDSITPQLDSGPDIDHVAIARRMEGDRTVQLSKAEKVELVAAWAATGRSMAECERITGISQVVRYQKEAS